LIKGLTSFNIIIVLHHSEEKVLMCRRSKEPYLGLLNMVGGKMETGETPLDGAYRELFEETGIAREKIALLHLLDFYYPVDSCQVTVYAGKLRGEAKLREEAHRLLWVNIPGTDFFSMAEFAGEGNIGHMMEHVRLHREKIDALCAKELHHA
jgi:8-oxo-dGTP diphosphatase